MTRRVIKPQPEAKDWLGICTGSIDPKHIGAYGFGTEHEEVKSFHKCPYGKPGDTLWVRETWYRNYPHEYGRYWYRADGEEIELPTIYGGKALCGKADGLKWRPSIFMTREAARIFLTVKDIRVERLQDITNEDAKSEGIDIGAIDDEKYQKNVAYRMLADNLPKARFGDLWDSINKARGYGWDTNPWVWVIEFEKKEGGM